MPVGEDGRAHPLPYTPERPLIEQIGPKWAASETVSRNGAEVPALTVRLTDGPIPDPPETPAGSLSEPPAEDEMDEAMRSRIDAPHEVPAVSTRVSTPSLRRPDPARLNVPGLTGVLTAERTDQPLGGGEVWEDAEDRLAAANFFDEASQQQCEV